MSSSRSASITERVETPVGPLPRDWKVLFLDEICEINPESFDADDHEDDAFKYITLSNAEHGSVRSSDTVRCDDAPSRARRLVRDGDVLVGTVRPNQRSHGFVAEEYDEAVCSTGFGVLRTKDGVNSQFLIQEVLSRRFFRQMSAYVAGSGYPAVKLSDLDRHRVAVPPLGEQRKIASVLYTVDEVIENTECVIEKVRRVKKGLMQDLFHGRHLATDSYRDTMVGEVPDHWKVGSIGDVVHDAQYGLSDSLSGQGEYPVFRMNNIVDGHMVPRPMKYVDLSRDEFERYRMQEGDILFNRTNSLELVGKTGIFDLEGDFVFASYLVRLRANDRVKARYLNYYMNSPEAQSRMKSFATKGVSQANINATSIQRVRLPVPPQDEQEDIVSILRSVDEVAQANKAYRDKLQMLKTGLMQDLLTGEARTKDVDIEIPEEVAAYG